MEGTNNLKKFFGWALKKLKGLKKFEMPRKTFGSTGGTIRLKKKGLEKKRELEMPKNTFGFIGKAGKGKRKGSHTALESMARGPALRKAAMQRGKIRTDFDRLIEFVEEKGSVTKFQVSKSLEMSPKRVQECCDVLEQAGLVKINYPALGVPKVSVMGKKAESDGE